MAIFLLLKDYLTTTYGYFVILFLDQNPREPAGPSQPYQAEKSARR
jgi:hypothetical protein